MIWKYVPAGWCGVADRDDMALWSLLDWCRYESSTFAFIVYMENMSYSCKVCNKYWITTAMKAKKDIIASILASPVYIMKVDVFLTDAREQRCYVVYIYFKWRKSHHMHISPYVYTWNSISTYKREPLTLVIIN
jgi:hypothetical protein